MGYFSNGTEGVSYYEEFCSRCLHDVNEDCPVWAAHLMFAYQECNSKSNAKTMLDMLIPQTKDGLGNGRCTMFVESAHNAPVLPLSPPCPVCGARPGQPCKNHPPGVLTTDEIKAALEKGAAERAAAEKTVRRRRR